MYTNLPIKSYMYIIHKSLKMQLCFKTYVITSNVKLNVKSVIISHSQILLICNVVITLIEGK